MADTLFDLPDIKTQGIKYAGSKLKILPGICRLFARLPEVKVILDGFAGTTRVSQALSHLGYSVICNDIAEWSFVFGHCYLKNTKPKAEYAKLINHLNHVRPYHGWFSEHYGGKPNGGGARQTDGLKKPFQLHNTQKLDAIRDEIDNLNLSQMERYVALTSLVLALEKVDSTLGHYASYLKRWSERSYRNLHLDIPAMQVNEDRHEVRKGNVFDAAHNGFYDACYFDPPYGSHNQKMPPSRVRYAAYYHLWKTVILHDKPDTFGAAKRREDSSDAEFYCPFEDFRRDKNGKNIAISAIGELLASADCRYVVLSYSSGGAKVPEELLAVLSAAGRHYEYVNFSHHKNVMSQMRWSNEWADQRREVNHEYLFLLEK